LKSDFYDKLVPARGLRNKIVDNLFVL